MQAHHKKSVLVHGVGLHLVSYTLIGMLLFLVGAPSEVILPLMAALGATLAILAYGFYYHK